MHGRDAPELTEGLNLLERYTIIDHIGGGGMATIYRAHDSRLDRIVCVKLLRNVIEGSGSGGVIYQATYTHFLQEARSLSKLAHPNTLRIYDFGFLTLDDSEGIAPRPFQISEFLDGGNLETYVRARGTLRVVVVGLRPAEVGHQAIAQIFRRIALETGYRFSCRAKEASQGLAQFFGIQVCRDRGRTYQVAEQHRQMPPLAH